MGESREWGSFVARRGDFFLLVCLLALFVVQPILGLDSKLIRLFFVGIPLAATVTMIRERRIFLAGIGLALLAVASQLADDARPEPVVLACAILAYVYTIAVLLHRLFTHSLVTVYTVCGALSVYLLLGILWTLVYMLLAALDPASFGGALADPPAAELLYFSFVTLTTLGYGDIAPRTDVARNLAVLEAVVGQLYLITMVARLVSLMTTARSRGLRTKS